MIEFQRLLEYLREADQPGMPLNPGFPPTPIERRRRDETAMLHCLIEQIEANRLAIEELQKSLGCLGGPGFPQEVLADRAKLPSLPRGENGQAPGG
jgi:hypothetical protein